MWNRELIELLLTLYAQHENLYNANHRYYVDRVKRFNSFSQILESLQELNPKVTLEAIKSKMHGMRSQYMKELHEIKASQMSAASADDVYVPRLWWFSKMDFLRPYFKSRQSSSNCCNESNGSTDNTPPVEIYVKEDDEGSTSTYDDTETKQRLSPIPAYNKKRKLNKQLSAEEVTNCLDPLEAPSRPDRYDLMGKIFAEKLRGLEKHIALITEKKINDLLYEAEMGQLNEAEYN